MNKNELVLRLASKPTKRTDELCVELACNCIDNPTMCLRKLAKHARDLEQKVEMLGELLMWKRMSGGEVVQEHAGSGSDYHANCERCEMLKILEEGA